jgi:hypothetical protein
MENTELHKAGRLVLVFAGCVVVSLCLVFAIGRVVSWSATASDDAREQARTNRILGR